MVLKKLVPSIHSGDLVLVLSLPRALVDVSLRPLAIAGRNLFHADSRVFSVVSVFVEIWVWSAVGKRGVEESAVFSLKSSEHSAGVFSELGDPFFLRGELGKVLDEDFFGELVQSVQSLFGGSGRDLEGG